MKNLATALILSGIFLTSGAFSDTSHLSEEGLNMTTLTPVGMTPDGQFVIASPGDTFQDFAAVSFSGSYMDLTNTPVIPGGQVNSDWNSSSGISQILNKPSLATVATTGSYSDLSNKPTIPASQVNSDWNSVSGVSQVLNKPTLGTASSHSATDFALSATTVNGHALSSNVTVTASDVGSPSGSGNSTGTNTGDQTITITGDVTGSGTGSFATTIGSNKVSYAKIQQVAASSLLGNSNGSLANAGEITLGSGLAFSGTTLTATGSGGTITDLTGDVTASGSGSVAATIANNAVTTAKINNTAVTYAKMQNESATTLLGNATGSPASPSEITLGNGLAFSGSSITALRTTSTLTLSLAGSGATGTQISATKDSTIRCAMSTSTTSTIGGPSTSLVALKKCSTNSATEGNWTTVATLENDQTITLAIALNSIQVLKGQLCADVPAGWYAKLVNSGTGTHSETYVSAEQTLYG